MILSILFTPSARTFPILSPNAFKAVSNFYGLLIKILAPAQPSASELWISFIGWKIYKHAQICLTGSGGSLRALSSTSSFTLIYSSAAFALSRVGTASARIASASVLLFSISTLSISS